MKQQITGVVLAGGQSSRMGQDKSLLLFRKQQLISFSIQALKPYCQSIIISTSHLAHQNFEYPCISDEYKKIGPIAGIQSALKNSETAYVIILPCDSPMVKPQLVEFLTTQIDRDLDALVPKYGKHLEPLFAIYHKRILPIVEQQIENKNYRLTSLLEKINTKTIEVQDRASFVNINTAEDYIKLGSFAN